MRGKVTGRTVGYRYLSQTLEEVVFLDKEKTDRTFMSGGMMS